ncbi:craniofacial development protein 2-like [Mytilus trossulus]|uniref:craniofacial development protein 2-like n=1 Tax=Mytilus trossulus TaxID=6551 RepID=UPI003006F28E
MNGTSESQQEASHMKSILNARTKLKLGFWNVRTMYEAGKQAQVLREMKENKLHILGISECRWTGFGKNLTNTGDTIIYSGRNDDKHQGGVAIILNKSSSKSLIEYNPVSERIITARLNTKPIKTSIIQVYSPTNEADKEIKIEFYEMLQAEIEKIPKKDLTIIMGDFNAKVGQDNSGFERIMGKHGCGIMNENGEHLVDFCGLNNLVIGGTLFRHKDVHKLTWVSPGGRDKNQIDHIAINGKWRRSLQDVRVRRGADVGSDHHLVTANIKLKLMRASEPCRVQRFDTGKLRHIKNNHDFKLELKNRFQLLEQLKSNNTEESETVDEQWQEVEDLFKKTSEKILGFKRQKHKEWIKQETWSLIDNRKELKKKICNTHSDRLKDRLRGQYSNCNKDVKKATRKDKKDFIEGLALEAENKRIDGMSTSKKY